MELSSNILFAYCDITRCTNKKEKFQIEFYTILHTYTGVDAT